MVLQGHPVLLFPLFPTWTSEHFQKLPLPSTLTYHLSPGGPHEVLSMGKPQGHCEHLGQMASPVLASSQGTQFRVKATPLPSSTSPDPTHPPWAYSTPHIPLGLRGLHDSPSHCIDRAWSSWHSRV